MLHSPVVVAVASCLTAVIIDLDMVVVAFVVALGAADATALVVMVVISSFSTFMRVAAIQLVDFGIRRS
jgi:hypothetical protein